MEIQLLNSLKNYPSNGRRACVGIPESEISSLEVLFNEGNLFPKALRELLFIAGDSCTVLEYGIVSSQQNFQDIQREHLSDAGISIDRKFYILDDRAHGDPMFIYLDEGDDPMVYQMIVPDLDDGDTPLRIRSLKRTLSKLIDFSVQLIKDGYGAF